MIIFFILTVLLLLFILVMQLCVFVYFGLKSQEQIGILISQSAKSSVEVTEVIKSLDTSIKVLVLSNEKKLDYILSLNETAVKNTSHSDLILYGVLLVLALSFLTYANIGNSAALAQLNHDLSVAIMKQNKLNHEANITLMEGLHKDLLEKILLSHNELSRLILQGNVDPNMLNTQIESSIQNLSLLLT